MFLAAIQYMMVYCKATRFHLLVVRSFGYAECGLEIGLLCHSNPHTAMSHCEFLFRTSPVASVLNHTSKNIRLLCLKNTFVLEGCISQYIRLLY